MAAIDENPEEWVRLLSEAVELLRPELGGPGRRLAENRIRWMGGYRPIARTIGDAAFEVWNPSDMSQKAPLRSELLALFTKKVPGFGPEWKRTDFKTWIKREVQSARAQQARDKRRRRIQQKRGFLSNARSDDQNNTASAVAATKVRAHFPIQGASEGKLSEDPVPFGKKVGTSTVSPDPHKVHPGHSGTVVSVRILQPDSIVEPVNRLFADARITVLNRRAILNAEIQLDLTPLYDYVASLQRSATILSYFPGIPDIQLDSMYVELCAAEDQRGFGMDALNSWQEADKVRPDHWALWRAAAAAKSIPLETLISKTVLLPVVVFGDPGSGKSTLTSYALHDLGRCLVDPKRATGVRVLPFRIELRKFAEEGKEDQFSILRHLARRHLGVPADTLDDWVTLLGYLFTDTKPTRLFLLVDGIDEVSPATAGCDLIHQRLREVASIARMLFTSRRAGFKSPVTGYEAYEVIDLSPMSIHAMIRNWFTVVTPRSKAFIESLSRWIFADSRRQEMAANPCLLSLICYLNQDRRAGKFLQPRSRARLYELVVQKLIDACKDPLPADPHLLKSALATFALKRYRAEDDRRAPLYLFNELQLETFLPTWKPSDSSVIPRLTAAKMLKTWRDLRLVFQWNLSGWHYFLHLTIQEYFAAQALFELSEEELAQVIDRHRFNPHWREVWRFYAGLCRTDHDSGKRRFQVLLRGFTAEQDLFGELPFLAAPLCAEYRLSDTSDLLDIDLKLVLYEAILTRHRASMKIVASRKARLDRKSYFEMQEARISGDPQLIARVKILVDLSPEYFLEVARRVIEEYRFRRGERRDHSKPRDFSDRADVLLASLILSSNYDQEALEFQAKMILEEATDPSLEIADPPMGPLTPSGRNEGLTGAIVAALSQARGWLAKERLIRYLANTRDPNAAQTILDAAEREAKSTPAPRALAFRVQCLNALCELQDASAVKLADKLVHLPAFRKKYLDQICANLALVNHPAVADLLERWLTEKLVPVTGMAFQHLLIELRNWRERKVPEIVHQLIADPTTDSALRVKAWDLLLSRTVSEPVDPLRKRLRRDQDRHLLPDEEWQELASLAELVIRHRLPMGADLRELATRVPRACDTVLKRIEGALLSWHAVSAAMPDSHAWLVNEGIPRLKNVLQDCAQAVADVPWAWLEVFTDCPVAILRQLAGMIQELWPILAPSVRSELMQNFSRNPQLFPRPLLDEAMESQDEDLRGVATELLLGIDPGRLIQERMKDPAVDRLLQETSATSGILFFADRLYSPHLAAFVPYAAAPKIPLPRRLGYWDVPKV